MTASPRTLRVLATTRLQGALFDAALGLAVGAGLGRAIGQVRNGALAGALVGLLAGFRWGEHRAARALQRESPRLGSALEALLEGQGGELRAHLADWVDARTRLKLLWPELKRLFVAGLAANLFGALASLFIGVAHHRIALRAASAPLSLEVRALVTPPVYAKKPAFTAEGNLLQALRGSSVQLQIRSNRSVVWSEAGATPQPLELHANEGAIPLLLDRTRTLRIAAGDEIRVLQLEAIADAPPQVALLEPAIDRVETSRPGRIRVRATARDDLAVASLAIRWTLSQGHGEATHFRSGTADVKISATAPGAAGSAIASAADNEIAAEGSIDPVRAGMLRGDTLVIWAEATDNNAVDGPGRSRSGARIVRWEETLVDLSAASSGTRIPPPASPLSEKELLARTERLVRAHPSPAQRRETSELLAEDQRTIRTSFNGLIESREGEEEMDVDDKEVAELGDRRGQRLLAQAIASMWEAEASLSIGDPAHAIAPEQRAVKALDAAFGIERYSLRADAQNKPVSEARRLRGDARELHPLLRPLAALHPESNKLSPFARTLLLAAQSALSREDARALADALWALPAAAGLQSANLAAKLYAAPDATARQLAAREAGEALARAVRPPPPALPPIDSREGAMTRSLDASPLAR